MVVMVMLLRVVQGLLARCEYEALSIDGVVFRSEAEMEREDDVLGGDHNGPFSKADVRTAAVVSGAA